MKTEIVETHASIPRVYPYLGINRQTGMVVLFVSPEAGAVVHKGNGAYSLLHSSHSWLERSFDVFTGKLTISN